MLILEEGASVEQFKTQCRGSDIPKTASRTKMTLIYPLCKYHKAYNPSSIYQLKEGFIEIIYI